MARQIDLATTTYWWVPGLTEPTTAAAVTAGVNISQYLHPSTKVGPTKSDTVSEKGITDVANSDVPIIGNYEGTLVGFRDFTSGAPTANDLMTTVANAAGVSGWIVKRVGFASTVAAAASQKVDKYLFVTDNPIPGGGEGDGYVKVTIPLFQQGTFKLQVALT